MKTLLKIKAWLSHRPTLYAFIGGTGVILFWRGIWLTMDFLMIAARDLSVNRGTINFSQDAMWWDGPLSILLGAGILLFTSAFVSSLIGNEIIISGLKAEKKMTEKEDELIAKEGTEIDDIRRSLEAIDEKLDDIEQH